MTSPVRTLICTIIDEFGGKFDNAFVAIRGSSSSAQTTRRSETCEGEYVVKSKVEAITYQANYWYSTKTKSKGNRSRPLLIKDGPGYDDVINVDLSRHEIIEILAKGLSEEERDYACIESDLKSRSI
ncbi:MAG: hypothetical protein V3R25_05975 [Nitrosomonadaceae bacterium]